MSIHVPHVKLRPRLQEHLAILNTCLLTRFSLGAYLPEWKARLGLERIGRYERDDRCPTDTNRLHLSASLRRDIMAPAGVL